jgi:asparagine synthase (glutamine-hydrolysing)
MSGLAGVRWLDEARRATLHDLVAPLHSLAHRGPDGLHAHASGPCALGIARSISTAEAFGEVQPHVTHAGVVLTLDGRIDNCDELRAALGISQHAAPSDVAVIAESWERWGADALERVHGDFALAIWDWRARSLVLARDVFGLRPLFYREYAGALWWASELQTLARLGDARVHEAMVGEYLSERVTSEVDTLVHGVRRLPRASLLTFTGRNTTHVRRYWQPRIGSPDETRRDDDAIEQFRDLFSRAVRARVRHGERVALMLSGGIDSSLIAAEAGVETYTTAWPYSAADESTFARAVADHLALPSIVMSGTHVPRDAYELDAERKLDLPESPNSKVAHPLRQQMQQRGVRVVLNGVGADEWFTGTQFAVADDLRSGQWWQAITRLRERHATGHSLLRDVRLALWVQLSEGAKQHARTWCGVRATPAWIRDEFAKRTDLESRLRAQPPVTPMPSYDQQLMFAWATDGDAMFLGEHSERIDASYGFEGRSPFFDRRLVEWALTLSTRHRRRDGASKWVLRRAAEGRLPSATLARSKGADFSFMTAEALHRCGGWDYVNTVARRRREWIDPAAVRQLWQAMRRAEVDGRRLGFSSWVLWLIVATDLAASAIERCRMKIDERRELVQRAANSTLGAADTTGGVHR